MKYLIIYILIAICIFAEEKEFRIPTDPKARYFFISETNNDPGKIIVVKRIGSSGTSYSKRLYDCKGNFKYLGVGNTIEKMNSSMPDKKMSTLFKKSISWYVGEIACGRWKPFKITEK